MNSRIRVDNVEPRILMFHYILTYLCRVDSSTLTFWTRPFPTERMSGHFLLLLCFKEIPVFKTNSVDPDQTPLSTASDQGLQCL